MTETHFIFDVINEVLQKKYNETLENLVLTYTKKFIYKILIEAFISVILMYIIIGLFIYLVSVIYSKCCKNTTQKIINDNIITHNYNLRSKKTQ